MLLWRWAPILVYRSVYYKLYYLLLKIILNTSLLGRVIKKGFNILQYNHNTSTFIKISREGVLEGSSYGSQDENVKACDLFDIHAAIFT